MSVGLSHGGTTMYTAHEPSTEVLVGTMDGLVALRRSGGSWSVERETLDGLHVHAILLDESSGTIFAGAYRGGLYASVDGGATWEQRDNGIGVKSLFCLAKADIGGKRRIFAGTEPAHLYYSDDAGAHWDEFPKLRSVGSLPRWRFAADPFEAHTKHINFDPADPGHLYVSIEVGGLLESTDGGRTWADIDVPHPDVHRTVMDPRTPGRLLTSGGAGLLETTDGGATWNQLLDKTNDIGAYPDLLVHVPSDPDEWYLAASQTGPRSWVDVGVAGGRIGRSRDGGRTWSVLTGGLPDRMHGNVEAMCIEEAGGTVSLFAGSTDGEVWWSDDAGDSWTRIAEGLAPICKSVHSEMLTGERTSVLRFSDGEQRELTA